MHILRKNKFDLYVVELWISFIMKKPGNVAELGRRTALKRIASLTAFPLFCGSQLVSAAQRPALKTLTPGTITVAGPGYAPFFSAEGDRVMGIDGDIVSAIAGRLGLKVKPVVTSGSTLVQSVLSGRADVAVGDLWWKPERATILACTDAIYYLGSFAVVRKSAPTGAALTVGYLRGKRIGTENGFSIIPEMKRIPGISDMKLYDSTDACIRDVIEGRLDVAVLDGPVVDLIIKNNPTWDIKQIPFTPDPAFPLTTGINTAMIGVSPDNPELFEAFNAGVRWAWKTGLTKQLLLKNDLTQPSYLMPPQVSPRIGVDRDKSGAVIGQFANKSPLAFPEFS